MKQFTVTISHHSQPDLEKALEAIGQRLGTGLIPGAIKFWESAFGAGYSCKCSLILDDDFSFTDRESKSSKKGA